MRRRIYIQGKPAWSPNEPDCHARVSGYGGSALGHAITVVHAAPTIRSDRDIARQRRRAETKRLYLQAHPDTRKRVRQ